MTGIVTGAAVLAGCAPAEPAPAREETVVTSTPKPAVEPTATVQPTTFEVEGDTVLQATPTPVAQEPTPEEPAAQETDFQIPEELERMWIEQYGFNTDFLKTGEISTRDTSEIGVLIDGESERCRVLRIGMTEIWVAKDVADDSSGLQAPHLVSSTRYPEARKFLGSGSNLILPNPDYPEAAEAYAKLGAFIHAAHLEILPLDGSNIPADWPARLLKLIEENPDAAYPFMGEIRIGDTGQDQSLGTVRPVPVRIVVLPARYDATNSDGTCSIVNNPSQPQAVSGLDYWARYGAQFGFHVDEQGGLTIVVSSFNCINRNKRKEEMHEPDRVWFMSASDDVLQLALMVAAGPSYWRAQDVSMRTDSDTGIFVSDVFRGLFSRPEDFGIYTPAGYFVWKAIP